MGPISQPKHRFLLPAQIAPTRLRGTLGSINQLLICVGILGALLVNVAFPASAWRVMFGASAVPAVLLGLGAAGKRGWGGGGVCQFDDVFCSPELLGGWLAHTHTALCCCLALRLQAC